MKLILLLTLASITALNASENENLINKLLPDSSLIKIICNKEPRGTEWFGYDSSTRQACDEFESILKQLFEDLEQAEKYGRFSGKYKTLIYCERPHQTTELDPDPHLITPFGYTDNFPYYFKNLLKFKLYRLISTLGYNRTLINQEFDYLDASLSNVWKRAETILQQHQEQLVKLSQADASIAKAAILARYSK